MADKQSREVVVDSFGDKHEVVKRTDEGVELRWINGGGGHFYQTVPYRVFERMVPVDPDGQEAVMHAGERVISADEAKKSDLSALTVKLGVDVSDAITGLKALQREAKDAAKALREVEFSVTSRADSKTGDITVNLHVDSSADPAKLADAFEKALRNLPKGGGGV